MHGGAGGQALAALAAECPAKGRNQQHSGRALISGWTP